MKNIKFFSFLFFGVMFLAVSCTPPYKMLFSTMEGKYKGEKYMDKKTGKVTSFTATDRPEIYFSDSLIISIAGKSVERLYDVRKNDALSNPKKGVIIATGISLNGTLKSIRMVDENYEKKGSIGVLITGNVIIGEYSNAKDTVDIYYNKNLNTPL